MEIKVDGTTYEVSPIPPHLTPYSSRISALMNMKHQNIAEVESASTEINDLMNTLLKGTVKPEPKQDHVLALFNAVIDLTNKVIKDACFFRKQLGLDTEKGDSASPDSP